MLIRPIILAFTVLSISTALFLSCNQTGKNPSKHHQAQTKELNPKFKKEGELIFFAANRIDTIKQIALEFAETEEEITQGLMYRRSVPDSIGMIFIFDQAEPRSFWMRNTYVPLDILFINDSQQIVTIRANTRPLSDESVPSSAPAQYVLEVVGGFCEKYGITEGDYVSFEKAGPSS